MLPGSKSRIGRIACSGLASIDGARSSQSSRRDQRSRIESQRLFLWREFYNSNGRFATILEELHPECLAASFFR